CRALVIAARIARSTRLSGTAEPVVGAGEGDWTIGDLRDSCKMACACLGVAERAKRVPAGMELCINCMRGTFSSMGGGKLVGGRAIPEVEQFARQHAALNPPLVGIDQRGGVARSLEHDR